MFNMLRCRAAPRARPARSVPSRNYTTPARPQRVGFIGLGNMGARMAANLQKAGHRLVVNDVSVTAAKDLVAKGAKFVDSPREAAHDVCAINVARLIFFWQVDAVITMLPSSPHVKEVYLDSTRGVLAYGKHMAIQLTLTGAPRAVHC